MKKIVAGGATAAVVAALAVLTVPVGADAGTSAPHPSARQEPSARQQASAHARAHDAARAFVRQHPGAVRAGQDTTFQAGGVLSSHGLQYVPYERTYRGLPVVGGDFVVATDSDGNVLATSVAQTRATSLSATKATVSKAKARAASKALLRHASLGRTTLVVLQQGGSQLAWDTMVTGVTKQGEASRQTVYVAARGAGQVLSTQEHVADGTGDGAINGSGLSFGTTATGGGFSMEDPTLANTSCQDADTNQTFTAATDDAWGGGAGDDKETACVDALFATDTEAAMLADWDGRDGQDGAGGAWPIRIGLDDLNAYYDGTQVQIGHNEAGDWIPSMDVLGHELGHGVDDHTPGGISGKGTQEFVADTFGAATEWYADGTSSDTPDYTVGEEIDLVGSGPIRVMYDPSQVGDDNCYSSATPTGEVHAAAGPGNHWFYLLAEGSAPTDGQPASPTCDGSSVTGVGIEDAEKIMYNAMLLKTSSSSYLKYRTWTLTAAKNLFPGDCSVFGSVEAAWDAVSVPAQSADPAC